MAKGIEFFKSPSGSIIIGLNDGNGGIVYRQVNGDPYEDVCEGIEPYCCEGLSAYDIAVNNGFVGTEQEWIESLQGVDGVDGTNGIDGVNGIDGTDGVTPQPIWNGTELSWDLDNDGVADTTAVDLQGASAGGPNDNWGTQVIQHAVGSQSSGDGTSSSPLNVNTEWTDVDGKPLLNQNGGNVTGSINLDSGEFTLNAPSGGTGTDDQTAGEVSFAPTGNTTSTDVQSAIEELQVDIDNINTNDNWGSQVIEHAVSSLSFGAGTLASPLNVSVDYSRVTNTPTIPQNLFELSDVPPYPNDGNTYILEEDSGALSWVLKQVVNPYTSTYNDQSISVGQTSLSIDMQGSFKHVENVIGARSSYTQITSVSTLNETPGGTLVLHIPAPLNKDVLDDHVFPNYFIAPDGTSISNLFGVIIKGVANSNDYNSVTLTFDVVRNSLIGGELTVPSPSANGNFFILRNYGYSLNLIP